LAAMTLAAVLILGFIGKQILFLAALFIVSTTGNALSLSGAERRGSFGIAGGPIGMCILLFVASMGSIGQFYTQKPDCRMKHARGGNAKLLTVNRLRPYDVITVPDRERLYAVYKEGTAAEIDLRTGETLSTVTPGIRGSMQRLIYNPEKDEIYSTFWRGQNHSAVIVMSAKPFRMERVIGINNCPAIWLELDHKNRQLIVVCEAGDKLVWIDYDDWNIIGELHFPKTTWPHAAALDEKERRIYVCSGSMSKYLYEIDADKKRILRRCPIGYATLGMAYDPYRRKIFLSKPIASKILVVDTSKMKTSGIIRARPGVRDLDTDQALRTLYAGNYIAGTVESFSLNPPYGRKCEQTCAKQIRGIFRDKNRRITFAATACGIFETSCK